MKMFSATSSFVFSCESFEAYGKKFNSTKIDLDEQAKISNSRHAGHAHALRRCVEDQDEFALWQISSEDGFDINEADNSGMTALMRAAHLGLVDMVRQLQKLSAAELNLDLQDADGRTALLWAVHMGHEEVVKELLEAGARLDVGDHVNETPLLAALRTKQVGMVKIICNHIRPLSDESRYLNVKSSNDPMSLLLEWELKGGGSLEAVRKGVTSLGSDRSLLSASPGSILDLALERNDSSWIKLLLGSSDTLLVDLDSEKITRLGGLSLHSIVNAVVNQKWDALQALWDCHVLIEKAFNLGLYTAANLKDEDFYRAWGKIENYSGMHNTVMDDEVWPIMIAIEKDWLPAVKLLKDFGTHVGGCINGSGQSPLARAVELKRSEIVNYLLWQHQCPIENSGGGGSALFYAVKNSDRYTFEILTCVLRGDSYYQLAAWEGLKAAILFNNEDFARHVYHNYVEPCLRNNQRVPGFGSPDSSRDTVKTVVEAAEGDWARELLREYMGD